MNKITIIYEIDGNIESDVITPEKISEFNNVSKQKANDAINALSDCIKEYVDAQISDLLSE